MNICICPRKYVECVGPDCEVIRNFAGYAICKGDGRLDITNVDFLETEHCLFGMFGSIYDEANKSIEAVHAMYREYGPAELMRIDGEFVFFRILENGQIEIVADREGVFPIYYRIQAEGLIFSTDESRLLYDYKENDIDFHAINDFLRFGTVVGNKTFSLHAKLLEAGYFLRYSNGQVVQEQVYQFYYKPEDLTEEELMREITDSYRKAIKKRLPENIKDMGVFLSGGLDSRLLLAFVNQMYPGSVSTITFGQKSSEEVRVAKECAEIEGNPFQWICTDAKQFVVNAEEYIKEVCGNDMFPQSYIIDAAKGASCKYFMTGFALDAYLGGSFLKEDLLNEKCALSECINDNLNLVKMKCFSEKDLELILKPEVMDEIRRYGTQSLVKAAEKYDDIPIQDAIQPFAIHNRAKRMVLLREFVPADYRIYKNPTLDKDFMNSVSKLPARFRLNHRFYQKLFCIQASEYAEIPYNNTTLPVFADVELWKEGSKNEERREKLYEKVIEEYNKNSDRKIYYLHFYSDFNGFSRYDEDWSALFERYLLNEDAFIYKWFLYDKLCEYYEEHKSGKVNRRKELIYLTSLEIFFNLYLTKGRK